ncbi:unnamed protein product [Prunus armeniaca]|uniref:Uncharacterized protein n=1 Tax=Prunus armeniaca TaxID=36596 RepID=A0A6J5TZY3_PRUAR|nr:unnamed protein product [Prunus armeniaca]
MVFSSACAPDDATNNFDAKNLMVEESQGLNISNGSLVDHLISKAQTRSNYQIIKKRFGRLEKGVAEIATENGCYHKYFVYGYLFSKLTQDALCMDKNNTTPAFEGFGELVEESTTEKAASAALREMNGKASFNMLFIFIN